MESSAAVNPSFASVKYCPLLPKDGKTMEVGQLLTLYTSTFHAVQHAILWGFLKEVCTKTIMHICESEF